jgi:rhamnosyltransferase
MGNSVVIGIIVTYYPIVDEVLQSLKSLKDEIDEICLIENGSGLSFQKNLIHQLQKVKSKIPKLHWISNNINLGLSKAQNQGIAYGLSRNFDFFLLLDDDSILEKGSVSTMIKYFLTHSEVGIIAPSIIHQNSKRIQMYPIIHKLGFIYRKRIHEDQILSNVSTVIASGSLIRNSVIQKIGLMNENFFIDYIDIEYCLRLRLYGWKIAVLGNSLLIHKLGNEEKVKHMFGAIYPTNHSPLRRYHMTRNRIFTWRMYAVKFPLWFIYDFSNFIFDLIRFSVFENQKLTKWKMLWIGLCDGLLEKKE